MALVYGRAGRLTAKSDGFRCGYPCHQVLGWLADAWGWLAVKKDFAKDMAAVLRIEASRVRVNEVAASSFPSDVI